MKNKNYNSSRLLVTATSIFMLFAVIYGCKNTKKETTPKEEAVETVEAGVVIEEDVWVIDEHQINDIPVTSKAKSVQKPADEILAAKIAKEKAVEMEEAEIEEAEIEEAEYEIYTRESIDAAMEEQAYEATEVVEVTEAVVPVDETQTVVSYNKKGKAQASFQVISSGPDNEIEQIIFTDKKHKDVYDVKAGMSGKDVKKLRREMKHMVKKGKVFLYDDQSNVMYLMDAKDMAGDEVTAADVENMDVQAIIWKDKKHHKKK